MAITLVNPDGMPKIDLYNHVSVATGSKLIFMAGQVAWGPDGRRSARETTRPRSSSAT